VITPGILKRALVRAAQWRLFLLSPLVLLIPTLAAMLPIARFLGEQFDHALRWKELTQRIDGATLLDLLSVARMPQTGAALAPGFQAGLLLTLLLSPLVAGAALTVAGRDERPSSRDLLRGAGALYGRLWRMQVASLMPYLACGMAIGGLGAWQGKLAENALTETQVTAAGRWFTAAMVLLTLVATLLVDAGRAWFVAQPERRSAFFALGAGIKLVVRRPVVALSAAVSTALLGLGLAAVVLVLRQQVTQSGPGAVLLAALLGVLATALVAYGHAARLCALVELAQTDLADRTRAIPSRFEMEPPKTSPPPPRPVPVTMPVDYGAAAEPEIEPALDDTSAALAIALGGPDRGGHPAGPQPRAEAAPIAPPAPPEATPAAAPIFTPLPAPEGSRSRRPWPRRSWKRRSQRRPRCQPGRGSVCAGLAVGARSSGSARAGCGARAWPLLGQRRSGLRWPGARSSMAPRAWSAASSCGCCSPRPTTPRSALLVVDSFR